MMCIWRYSQTGDFIPRAWLLEIAVQLKAPLAFRGVKKNVRRVETCLVNSLHSRAAYTERVRADDGRSIAQNVEGIRVFIRRIRASIYN